MIKPEWTPQPFPPGGAATADGLRRQLGTPRLDALEVLVREASQNSWDARFPELTASFTLDIETVDGERLGEWRRALGGGPNELDDLLAQSSLDLLVVGDRSTTGLGGPLHAGVVTQDAPDFVNFVRSSGEVRDTRFGGGTYGFGKGAYYRASKVSTILVHTACFHEGRIERRLIGCALSPAFNSGDRRFTGRFFWGQDIGDVTDPLLNQEATRLAARLGLPGFGADETGTDIVVVGLDCGTGDNGSPRTISQVAEHLASACMWNLWPKMLDRPGRSIQIAVRNENRTFELPHPSSVPRLAPFVAALARLDQGEGLRHTRKSAPTGVGSIAIEPGPAAPDEPTWITSAAPFSGAGHHCARMRNAELIVDYLEGPHLGTEWIHYGAVFRTDANEEVDRYFADAEPPTHDSWVLKHLSGTARGVVQGAGTFVRRELENYALSTRPGSLDDPGDIPLGGLSSRLASALPGSQGQGGEPIVADSRRGGGSASPKKKSSFRIVDGPVLRVGDTGLAEIVTTCSFDDPDSARHYETLAVAVTDSGTERSAPIGAESPQPRHWEAMDPIRIRTGGTLTLHPGDPLVWQSVVICPPDVAADVNIREVEADD